MRRMHEGEVRKLQADLFRPTRDAILGTWNCAHCKAVMQDHRSLRSHIGYQACSMFNPAKPDEVDVSIQDPEVVQAAKSHKLEDILRDKARCKYMANCCVVCGAEVQYSNRVRQHIARNHEVLYQRAVGVRDG